MNTNGFSITLQCEKTHSYWEVADTDCCLDELYNAFKGLLITQGFSEETINIYLKKLSNEIEN